MIVCLKREFSSLTDLIADFEPHLSLKHEAAQCGQNNGIFQIKSRKIVVKSQNCPESSIKCPAINRHVILPIIIGIPIFRFFDSLTFNKV